MADGIGRTVVRGSDARASLPPAIRARRPVVLGLLLLALATGLVLAARPNAPPLPAAAVTTFERYPWAYLRDNRPVAPEEEWVDLIAVGDVMPGRGVAQAEAEWTGIRTWLTAADLTLGNLEAILVAQTPAAAGISERNAGAILLSAPAGAAADFRQAGFDLLGVANNHSLDYGAAGLAESVEHLRRAGIQAIGLAGSDDLDIGLSAIDGPPPVSQASPWAAVW